MGTTSIRKGLDRRLTLVWDQRDPEKTWFAFDQQNYIRKVVMIHNTKRATTAVGANMSSGDKGSSTNHPIIHTYEVVLAKSFYF